MVQKVISLVAWFHCYFNLSNDFLSCLLHITLAYPLVSEITPVIILCSFLLSKLIWNLCYVIVVLSLERWNCIKKISPAGVASAIVRKRKGSAPQLLLPNWYVLLLSECFMYVHYILGRWCKLCMNTFFFISKNIIYIIEKYRGTKNTGVWLCGMKVPLLESRLDTLLHLVNSFPSMLVTESYW